MAHLVLSWSHFMMTPASTRFGGVSQLLDSYSGASHGISVCIQTRGCACPQFMVMTMPPAFAMAAHGMRVCIMPPQSYVPPLSYDGPGFQD